MAHHLVGNSLSHIWGYRNYATPDDSRNNALVGILAAGEGWRQQPPCTIQTSARHGHKWWEFDLTGLTIRAAHAYARSPARIQAGGCRFSGSRFTTRHRRR